MESCDPAAVANHFRRLSADEKIAFLVLVAKESAAETLMRFCEGLPVKEQFRLSEMLQESFICFALPPLIKLACQYWKSFPDGADEDAQAWVRDQYEQGLLDHDEATTRLARAEVKESYTQGPKAKAKKVKERNRVIEKECLDNGIEKPAKIFEYLKEHYPKLVSSGRGYIGEDAMMRAYQRSKLRG